MPLHHVVAAPACTREDIELSFWVFLSISGHMYQVSENLKQFRELCLHLNCLQRHLADFFLSIQKLNQFIATLCFIDSRKDRTPKSNFATCGARAYIRSFHASILAPVRNGSTFLRIFFRQFVGLGEAKILVVFTWS
jgi:hypothetical protein